MIVDDEPIARDILSGYIEKTSGLSLLSTCRNAVEAYQALYEQQIDLILLDIQMPVITGTEFLRSLSKPPHVIFTTAYSHFALEGFELNSVDYLLKPITFERFYTAIEKVRERVLYRQQHMQEGNTQLSGYIFIKQDKKLLRVTYNQISYLQAEKDFCSIHLGEKEILSSNSLKFLENVLPPKQFVRVHRSHLVNLEKIIAIRGNTIQLLNAELTIGASYRESLFEMLKL